MNEKKEFNEAVLQAIAEVNKKTHGELTFDMRTHINNSFWGKSVSKTTTIEIKITENL